MNSNKSLNPGYKPESDLNCNENVTSIQSASKDTNSSEAAMARMSASSFIHESTEFQWYMDDACAREYKDDYGNQPTSIFSFEETQSSYDDISKNIDANLAEIDMETFRSGDINSILSLPAMFGESFSSITDNTHNTSESCTSTGKMETASHSLSDGSSEISVYKNKPLFSPLKEPEIRLAAISTDSLDFSSLGKQDLSYQAKKNDYVIAFEASGTHLSDESNGSVNKFGKNRAMGRGTMIQSDVNFTTWSKIQEVKKTDAVKQSGNGNKSFSLPNLSPWDLSVSDWHKMRDTSVLIYNVHNRNSVRSKALCQSLSLWKLYMKDNFPTLYLNKHELFPTVDCQPKDDNDNKAYAEDDLVDVDKGIKICAEVLGTDSNENFQNSAHKMLNAFRGVCSGNNNGRLENVKASLGNENDTSLYFEDSLMEITAQKTKVTHVSPIMENPHEVSFGNEVISGNEHYSSEKDKLRNENGCNNNPDASLVTVAVSTSENYLINKNLSSNSVTQNFPLIAKESASQSTQTKCVNQLIDNGGGSLLSTSCINDHPISPRKYGENNTSTYGTETQNSIKPNDKIIIAEMCHNSTQIPVHVTDKAVQTSFSRDYEWKTVEYDQEICLSSSGKVEKEGKQCSHRKPFYIYCPNFSLPDLSFLNRPLNTKERSFNQLPAVEASNPSNSDFSRRRARSSEGRGRLQPHDCRKRNPVNQIEDWASLSVLLPENVKGFIKNNVMTCQRDFSAGRNACRHTFHAHGDHIPKRFQSLERQLPEQYGFPEKFQKSEICSKAQDNSAMKDPTAKRWSLQEPLRKYAGSGSHELLGCRRKEKSSSCKPSTFSAKSRPSVCDNIGKSSKNLEEFRTHYGEELQDIDCQLGSHYDKMHNTEEDSAKSSHSSDSNAPPHLFTVSPVTSTSDEEESQEFTIEKRLWTNLVQAKHDLIRGLEDSVSRIMSFSIDSRISCEQVHVHQLEGNVMAFAEALLKLLSDGICSSGGNHLASESVWKMIQAVCYDESGCATFEPLERNIREQRFEDFSLKFFAFVTGLLNLGWFHYWFMHMVACIGIIRLWYSPTALLYLMTFKLAKPLNEEMSFLLKPLDEQKFKLNPSIVLSLACTGREENRPCYGNKKFSSYPGDMLAENKQDTDLDYSNRSGWGIAEYPKNFSAVTDGKHIEIAHNHAVPNRKTKTLKETVNDAPLPIECFENGAGSEDCHDPNELPKFQQLRQQWEKLACMEDSTASKVSVAKASSGKFSDAEVIKQGFRESPEKPAGKVNEMGQCRRRSLIPVHKSSKTIGKRSGSAPSEKNRRHKENM